MALDGKTPAQEAGINTIKEKGNKWMDLLELAMSENNGS
jgi:hypothetical protein